MYKIFKTIVFSQLILFSVGFLTPKSATEKILQKEEMSFEICLKVITTSANKLSITPEITDVKGEKRIAKFMLSDGVLQILCDKKNNLVVVSSN